jgi:hypothetical protein
MSDHWEECFSLLSFKGGMRLRICDQWYEGPPNHRPHVAHFNIDVERDKILVEGTVTWEPRDKPLDD